MLRPLLLAADNFTPPSRTPWGGRRIVGHYKAALGLPAALASQAVGESWELSLGPELPSRTAEGSLLTDLARAEPVLYFGDEAPRGGSALLVKWLDAADNLSVQIHPDAHDAGLSAEETGKPECWYVLEHAAGAGIYLGLQPGVDERSMRAALTSGDDVSRLLAFVPVCAGDFFLLSPGMPHAIGGGVTLLEPQYVSPGKKGVTLRYWDWNRRYDAQGREDLQGGKPRELHVERALGVTRWQRASNPTYLATQRCSAGHAPLSAAARLDVLCGPEASCAVHSTHLRVARLAGTGGATLPTWRTLTAITVAEGSVVLTGGFGEVRVEAGRTAALPAQLAGCALRAENTHALVSSVVA